MPLSRSKAKCESPLPHAVANRQNTRIRLHRGRFHPGVVATDFARDGDARGLWAFFFRWFRPFLRTPERGARTSVHLACDPGLSETTGGYFANSRPARPSSAARDAEAARRLWEVSEALLRR